jgi:hypothetical protein
MHLRMRKLPRPPESLSKPSAGHRQSSARKPRRHAEATTQTPNVNARIAEGQPKAATVASLRGDRREFRLSEPIAAGSSASTIASLSPPLTTMVSFTCDEATKPPGSTAAPATADVGRLFRRLQANGDAPPDGVSLATWCPQHRASQFSHDVGILSRIGAARLITEHPGCRADHHRSSASEARDERRSNLLCCPPSAGAAVTPHYPRSESSSLGTRHD